MKYQRLKSIDGSGTIMRYYELADDVAFANAFYGITDGKASKIVGTVSGATLIGFSHGGNNLAEGLVFLDINPSIVYMGILGEEDEGRPAIGDLVNGFQRVIDTHYDGDNDEYGKGANPEEWGIERLTNPYYLFTIEQPEASEFATEMDDEEAGEVSGVNFPSNKNVTGPFTFTLKNSTGQTYTMTFTPVEGDAEVVELADGASYTAKQKIPYGKMLSAVYSSITGVGADETPYTEGAHGPFKDDLVVEMPAD